MRCPNCRQSFLKKRGSALRCDWCGYVEPLHEEGEDCEIPNMLEDY